MGFNHKGQRPSRFLAEHMDLLPRGRALDVAMGDGRNAVYMARSGFQVEGIDISKEAVTRALEFSRKSGVKINARVTDLETGHVIEKEAYDVIICFHYLQRTLIPDIKNGLREGGMVVYETFIIDQVRFGRPKNPEYLLKYNELLDLFRDFRCLRYREGIMEKRKAVAGIVAEKI